MKIEIFYCYLNPYYQPKDSDSNIKKLEQLKADIKNILTEHPNAKIMIGYSHLLVQE